MEFFKQADIDWMGKAKYFFALSALLLVVGMASLIAKGGPYYGIDFKGGTVVDVRFAGTPPIDTIRNGLAQQGIGNSTIVPISDIARPNSNEVLINLEEKGEGAEALDAGKAAILTALHATLGAGEPGKQMEEAEEHIAHHHRPIRVGAFQPRLQVVHPRLIGGVGLLGQGQ